MEFQDGPMITVGATPTFKVLFHSLCFIVACIQLTAEGKALSQATDQASSIKPMIYIDIPRWEDRAAYPRFLIYRDQFRRRLENKDNEDSQVSSYSKAINSSSRTGSNEVNKSAISSQLSAKENLTFSKETNDSSSVEELYDEQRRSGLMPASIIKVDNANTKNAPDEPSLTNNVMNDPTTVYDKHVINFPKDNTNPCNRLQINPEEVEDASEQNINSESENLRNSTQHSESKVEGIDSLEIGNRRNFPGGSKPDLEGITDAPTEDLMKDSVPTFELTINIIQQSRWNDENAIFSPLSIANVLSMLLLGAGGETFKELSTQLEKQKNLVSDSWNVYRYHSAFKSLMKYLKHNSGNGVTLNSASEIFTDKSFPINEKFRLELLNFYEAPLESFDFGKDGYVFMDKLNKWVREKTQNQIQKILEEPPSSDTSMGIINAIHFKGPWHTPFSDKLTRWRDFHVHPKEKIKVQLMINILKIPYIERDLYQMTALPYKGNDTALVLILPKGNDGINDLKYVEKSLTRQELNESLALMEETKVALTLPKLKFSSDGEMARILQNMGLSSVFNAEKANFSAISSEPLFISKLLHRAVIEINEKGTEASAVTLGTADRIIDDLPIPFGCDKPFLFFIYHAQADTILFWGRVIRPGKNAGVS